MFEKHLFAMPQHLFEEYSLISAPKKQILDVQGFHIPSYVFEARTMSLFKRVLRIIRLYCDGSITENQLRRYETKIDSERTIPFYTYDKSSVVMDVEVPNDSDRPERWNIATEEYKKYLVQLSEITGGVKFTFHSDRSFSSDPFPDNPNSYHVFGHASPSGESMSFPINTAYGNWIANFGKETMGLYNTSRGVIIYDTTQEPKKPMLQIIGNNIYILIPCMGIFNNSSLPIFKILMTQAWNFIQTRNELGEETTQKPATTETCVAEIHNWLDEEFNFLGELIKKEHTEIDELRHKMGGHLLNIKRYSTIQKTLTAEATEHKKLITTEDVQKVKDDPRVDELTLSEGGITLKTNVIIAEHENTKYKIGTFSIRVTKRRQLYVWSEKSEHPDLIPHPHFANGTPCFGNATRVIEEAVSDLRWADVMKYVLDWLTYGYEDSLALRPITEWPAIIDNLVELESRLVEVGAN